MGIIVESYYNLYRSEGMIIESHYKPHRSGCTWLLKPEGSYRSDGMIVESYYKPVWSVNRYLVIEKAIFRIKIGHFYIKEEI